MKTSQSLLLDGIVMNDDGRHQLVTPLGLWSTLTACEEKVLTRLDGTMSLNEACANLSAEEATQAKEMVEMLRSAGLVHETVLSPPGRIAIVGAGSLATSCARACAPYSWELVFIGTNTVWNSAKVMYHTYLDEYPGNAASYLKHWTQLSHSDVDLVILAPETVEHDRALTTALARENLPHLITSAHLWRSHIGPLIVPGVTDLCCQLCLDSLATREMTGYGDYLLTAAQTRAWPHPLTLPFIATMCALTCFDYLAYQRSQLGNTRLYYDLRHSGIHVERWQPRLTCQCQWNPSEEVSSSQSPGK